MPEGDTIHRAAQTLHRALCGRTVTKFTSVYPRLTRIDDTTPIAGRVIERVEARGKHLLMWLSGDLVLRTHMRMHGSWHIYRPGERWQRPRHEMRVAIETDAFHAIGFSIPVAELTSSRAIERHGPLEQLGPDILSDDFDADEAIARLRARADVAIADALLDQTALAGIGNVYKSEVLFAAKVHPFASVREVTDEQLRGIVAVATRFLRANVTSTGPRRTTGRADPSARLWVYGRAGEPCRRCGTPVSRRRQGPHARSTYWCEECQASGDRPQASGLGKS